MLGFLTDYGPHTEHVGALHAVAAAIAPSAARIDLAHDAASRGQRVDCPLLVLWGAQGFCHRHYDVLNVWRDYARDARGEAVDCGHFLPEERPAEVLAALLPFLHGA